MASEHQLEPQWLPLGNDEGDGTELVPPSKLASLYGVPNKSDAGASEFPSLLASFAEFYEELALIKRAHRRGELAACLTAEGEARPVEGGDYAVRVRRRLLALLRQQRQTFQRSASVAESRAHQSAMYVMAALADEIFLLELRDWPGGDAWLELTLEQKQFGSNDAGERFFDLADQVIKIQAANPLYADLASVFLLALQLGFKGKYRGLAGAEALARYRQQLYRAANLDSRGSLPGRRGEASGRRQAFFEAYEHRIADGKDERLTPLLPWWKMCGRAAVAYLLLSTLIWLIASFPLQRAVGVLLGRLA